MTEFTRQRLEAIVDRALRSAGVLGVVPTPLDAVASVAGVRAVEPMPGELAARQVLGALRFDERTIYVSEGQSAPRRRFTLAHELAHALCPWHEAVLRIDTEDELFRSTRSTIEREANRAAGLLIFQGRRLGEAPAIDAALTLAKAHGASVHATLHHMVEGHDGAAALLVVGRFPQRDGSLPVWRSIESPAFTGRLPQTLRPGSELFELVERSRTRGLARASLAESYYNRHTFLVLLASPV
jgi:hypothetical protein